MRNIKDILLTGSSSIEALLHEAFEAGRAEGLAEAKAKAFAVWNSIPSNGDNALAENHSDSLAIATPTQRRNFSPFPENPIATVVHKKIATRPTDRAPPGTVRPEIIRLVTETHDGITEEEIEKLTGFKPNSIRGTIYQLLRDKEIERRGGRYFPVPKNDGLSIRGAAALFE